MFWPLLLHGGGRVLSWVMTRCLYWSLASRLPGIIEFESICQSRFCVVYGLRQWRLCATWTPGTSRVRSFVPWVCYSPFDQIFLMNRMKLQQVWGGGCTLYRQHLFMVPHELYCLNRSCICFVSILHVFQLPRSWAPRAPEVSGLYVTIVRLLAFSKQLRKTTRPHGRWGIPSQCLIEPEVPFARCAGIFKTYTSGCTFVSQSFWCSKTWWRNFATMMQL